MCLIQCCVSLVNMKLLAIVPILALVVSQTLALPTNGNRDQIDFIGDSIVHPVNDANHEQRIEFLQENEAENLEEALNTYTNLLLNRLEQKAGKQPKPKPIAERPNDQISIEAQLPDININQQPTYYDNQLYPITEELTIEHQPNDQLHPNIEGPDTSNNVVYDHTASDASCDCSQLKYSTFKRINRENGDSCIVGLGVPYCEKVYSASYG